MNAVTATDQQIDALVYELYGLTPEEIAIVEGTSEAKPSAPKSSTRAGGGAD